VIVITKYVVKSNIIKTKRLALALSLSFFTYRIIESKISPKTATTTEKNIVKNIRKTFSITSPSLSLIKNAAKKKIAINAIRTLAEE